MKTNPIASLYKQVLHELGAGQEPEYLDIENTPERVAKMFKELMAGYVPGAEQRLLKSLKLFPTEDRHEMVVEVGIPFTSICAHHMLPFAGMASIGYLPDKHLMGLSKMSRILDHFAARLQLQERLGAQVAEFIVTHAKPKAVFVMLNAQHGCMSARGIRRHGISTVTTSVRPQPPDELLLSEFYRMAEAGSRRPH